MAKFSVYVLVMVGLCVLILPSTQAFSNHRLVRRVASSESSNESNEESVSSDSREQYDSEEYESDYYSSPSQKEYTQILPANSTNSTDKNLYVIKAVVYEVGLLTDVPENDTDEDVTNERVDISLFNRGANDSVIDLEHIPFPVQANISGQVFTGVAPVPLQLGNLGHHQYDFSNTKDETSGVVGLAPPNLQNVSPILTANDVLPKTDANEENKHP